MFAHLLFLNIAWQTGVTPDTFNNYLLLGYAVMGIIGLVYIMSLAVRQRNLRQDIQLMERLLQDDEETAV